MAAEDFKRKLTAVLSADVVGYGRLMGKDEADTVRTLSVYKEIMFALIKQHRGRVIDSPGDNLLAEFASVVDAVQCGVAVQKELYARNTERPENRRMEFRMGINLGDVIEEEDRIFGDGVNIAARLEALADPGGICISKTAFDQIETKLPFGYEYLGEKEVKNIAKPVGAFRVLMDEEAAGKVIGEARPKTKQLRGAAIGGVVVLIIVAGALAIWNFYFRPAFEPASVEKMALPLPDKPSIAVLPFKNLSGDSQQEYLADGITESIIGAISRISGLFVIASNSVFTYKGKAVKVQQVSQELGVRNILEGTVQRMGNRLRIHAQLIDAITGGHLWSEKYDREMEDLFSVQDNISKEILTALRVKIVEGEQARVWAKSTSNIEAYLKFLQAYDTFKSFNKNSMILTRQICEEAIALDRKYDAPYTLIGGTHLIDLWFHWGESPRASIEKSEAALKKAIELNPYSDFAYANLGHLYLMQKRHEESVAAGEKSVELNPNGDYNMILLGITFNYVRRYKEAITLFREGQRRNPYSPAWYIHNMGITYFHLGRWDEAIAESQRALDRNPDHFPPLTVMAAVYGLAGRIDEARSIVQKILKMDPKFSLETTASGPYKHESDLEAFRDALRKAGIPETPPLPLPDKPSIAVLPFVNWSGDPKQEYLSDGITDSIIMAISKNHNLFVIARNSTFTYKGKAVKVKQVARELGVQYVLEGSMQRSGDRLRITAQLIDALDDRHIWSERYDRDLKDLFAMQDDITMEILTAMRVTLAEGEQVLGPKRPRKIETALKGYEAWDYTLRFTPEANAMAKKLSEEVIVMDPDWGEGYYILACTHMMDIWLGTTKSRKESFMRSIEYAEKAVSLDDSLSQALGVLGYLYGMKGEHDKSLAFAEKAIATDPNGADAHTWLGNCLNFAGKPQEAIPLYKKAMRLNPHPPVWYYINLGVSYYTLGRYEDAVAQYRKSLALSPNSLPSYRELSMVYMEMGKEDEARAAAKEVMRIDPNFSLEHFAKTLLQAYKDQDYVRRTVENLRKAGLR
jgi:adenylate cyclase